MNDRQPAQWYVSADGKPLCAHCAHADVAWPHDVADTRADDRCGRGWITMQRSVTKCYGYERLPGADDDSAPARPVTIGAGEAKETPTSWQERTDGMRLRKPK